MRSKILAMIALSLASFGASAGGPIYTGWFSDTAIKGYDSVAYFTESKAVKGDEQFSFSWQGANWHFASAAHRDLFANNPEKYAPQYGGYCAYALATKDALVKIDPEAWTVVDGKLYLNYSKSVRKDWLARQAEYIRQGDANWPKHASGE